MKVEDGHKKQHFGPESVLDTKHPNLAGRKDSRIGHNQIHPCSSPAAYTGVTVEPPPWGGKSTPPLPSQRQLRAGRTALAAVPPVCRATSGWKQLNTFW